MAVRATLAALLFVALPSSPRRRLPPFLPSRAIGSVIPEPDDQKAHR